MTVHLIQEFKGWNYGDSAFNSRIQRTEGYSLVHCHRNPYRYVRLMSDPDFAAKVIAAGEIAIGECHYFPDGHAAVHFDVCGDKRVLTAH